MERTIGCTEIHLLFAVISSISGYEVSKLLRNGSILPRKAPFGMRSFMHILYRESRCHLEGEIGVCPYFQKSIGPPEPPHCLDIDMLFEKHLVHQQMQLRVFYQLVH